MGGEGGKYLSLIFSTLYSRRERVLEELVTTEENYVEDLHSVLFGYRDRLEECEERIRQKSEEIFGNLEEIYDFHSQVRDQ